MPTVPEPVRPPVDIPPRADLGEWARIRARIAVTDRDWVWCGALSDDGYGRFWAASSTAQPPMHPSQLHPPADDALQLPLWPAEAADDDGPGLGEPVSVTLASVTVGAASTAPVVRPSRWMWQAYHGPIPDGHVIRHECDHSWCTRPACLRLGDQVDNLADAMRRDRVTHPGRVGKADRRGAAAAARAVRAAVLDAIGRGVYDPAALGAVVADVLAEGDPFADHERLL